MNRISLLSILLLMTIFNSTGYSQDSASAPRILIRPFGETGFNLIQNDLLKNKYQNQSMFYWAIGVSLGHPNKSHVIPFIKYSRSNQNITTEMTIRTTLPDNRTIDQKIIADSTLRINQLSAGVNFPLYRKDKFYLRSKVAYTISNVYESFYSVSGFANGCDVGIGIERSIGKFSRLYWDISYNYQKTRNQNFKDFDTIKISVGVNL